MWPADEGDDQARFLADLRALRDAAALGYEELAARAHYPSDVLKEAENGPRLPSLPILAAYVRACGGDVPEWEERWRRLGFDVRSEFALPVRPTGGSPAAIAGARAGTSIAPPEAYDPERIRAALRSSRQRSGEAATRTDAAASQATMPASGDRHPAEENETPLRHGGHDGAWGDGSPTVADGSSWVTPDQRGTASAGLAEAGRDEAATQHGPAPAPAGEETSPWFRPSPGTSARADPPSRPGTSAGSAGPASSGSSAGGPAWSLHAAAGTAAQARPAAANGSSPSPGARSGPAQQAVSQHPRRGSEGRDRARVLAIIVIVAVICGVLMLVLP